MYKHIHECVCIYSSTRSNRMLCTYFIHVHTHACIFIYKYSHRCIYIYTCSHKCMCVHVYVCMLKGGPEPLEKYINEILGSKRDDKFSNPFFELVQKTCKVRCSYLLRQGNLRKGLRTLRKFLQKIAAC